MASNIPTSYSLHTVYIQFTYSLHVLYMSFTWTVSPAGHHQPATRPGVRKGWAWDRSLRSRAPPGIDRWRLTWPLWFPGGTAPAHQVTDRRWDDYPLKLGNNWYMTLYDYGCIMLYVYIIYIYLYCTVCNHSWNCKPKYDKFSSVPSSTCSPLKFSGKSSKIPLAHRSQSSKPPMSRTDLSCESAKKNQKLRKRQRLHSQKQVTTQVTWARCISFGPERWIRQAVPSLNCQRPSAHRSMKHSSEVIAVFFCSFPKILVLNYIKLY